MDRGDGDRKPVCKYFGERIANAYELPTNNSSIDECSFFYRILYR